MSNRFKKAPDKSDVVTHVVARQDDGSPPPLAQFIESLPILVKSGYHTIEVPAYASNEEAIRKAASEALFLAHIMVENETAIELRLVTMHGEGITLVLLRC